MKEAIKYIQNYLKTNNIDAYIIFTNDDHGSEYVVDYYKQRAFLSGFTGSAGTMLITKDKSYLWTDGRYFLQAASQLQASGTILMKMGVEGVDSLEQFVGKLNDNVTVAFDLKLATVAFVENLKKTVKNITIVDNADIIDEVWRDRPAIPATKAYMLTDKQAGESVESKLKRTIEAIEKQGCEYGLVSALDDIAWLLNLRGKDITFTPVNYAFLLISKAEKNLYINNEKLNSAIVSALNKAGLLIKPYNNIYGDCASLKATVLLDPAKTNYCLYASLKSKKEALIFPTSAFKTIKNPTEIRNMIKAHKQDGAAVVKFMKWVKENAGKIEMDELSAQEQLSRFRKESKDCLDNGFGTICGYKGNGAIVHYSASETTNKKITNESLLLVDSGGQYKWGTTDITRTFVLGKLSKKEKTDFTLVLKSHIALADAVFPKGVNGYGLDVLARQPLHKNYKDFNHGTGHGVGYLLSVHEGPQSINMRTVNKNNMYPFVPGMITSDEPGIYLENEYGIRHESLILCVEKVKNQFNTFYGFEPITYVPFDLDGINVKMLTEAERNWLNSYHKLCYRMVAPLLDEDHKKYLKKITREI